jgi:flagellin
MTKLYNSYSAQKAIRYSKKTNNEIASSTSKLAGGKRITKASDDAAGLSISSKMKSLISSKAMATKNTSDAFGLLQVMDGVVSEMGNMVIRLRELAINSASDTVSNVERDLIQTEVTSILYEMKRVAENTEFGGQKLLTGEEKKLDFQVDTKNDSNSRIGINLKEFAQTPYALGITDVRVDTQHRARMALIKIDFAQEQLIKSRSKIGSTTNRLESTLNNLSVDIENKKSANSRIEDTDYAKETALNAKNRILSNAQSAVMVQVSNQGRNYLKLLE